MKKRTPKSPKYTKIANHKVILFWKNDCGCNHEAAELFPDDCQSSNIPICSECGSEMAYSHTKVALPKKKDKTREPLRRLVNYLESDPDLYEGDDDGTLRRLIDAARKELK